MMIILSKRTFSKMENTSKMAYRKIFFVLILVLVNYLKANARPMI